jgi:hypothetical protein
LFGQPQAYLFFFSFFSFFFFCLLDVRFSFYLNNFMQLILTWSLVPKEDHTWL